MSIGRILVILAIIGAVVIALGVDFGIGKTDALCLDVALGFIGVAVG